MATVSRAAAQQSGARQRLAICSPSEPTVLMNERSDNRYYRSLFAELRRLGHVEGQNLVIERYGREKMGERAQSAAARQRRRVRVRGRGLANTRWPAERIRGLRTAKHQA